MKKRRYVRGKRAQTHVRVDAATAILLRQYAGNRSIADYLGTMMARIAALDGDILQAKEIRTRRVNDLCEELKTLYQDADALDMIEVLRVVLIRWGENTQAELHLMQTLKKRSSTDNENLLS